VQDAPDSTVAYLRAAGARYVVVDDRWLQEGRVLARAEELGLRRLHREAAGRSRASVFAVESGPGG
jgi:hypothetical protein